MGVAVSDADGKIAFPRGVVSRKGIFPELQKSVPEWRDCEGFVLGIPKTLRGEIGHAAELVLTFQKELEMQFGKPVKLWDERMSTKAVMAGTPKNKIDALAAQFILQGYLDSLEVQSDA